MGLYVRVSLCRDLGKAKAHVKYIAFRSREQEHEMRGAFDHEGQGANVKAFYERLEDPMTRHPMANKAYKVTISLSEREFHERGLASWQPVVKEAMENLQNQWGRRFDWIAAEHMAKGHPHCHIVIKATCSDDTGRYRQLRLDKDHLKDLKREVGRVVDRGRPRQVERGPSLGRGDGLLRVFDAFLKGLIRAERESAREAERAHQDWLRGRQREREGERERERER